MLAVSAPVSPAFQGQCCLAVAPRNRYGRTSFTAALEAFSLPPSQLVRRDLTGSFLWVCANASDAPVLTDCPIARMLEVGAKVLSLPGSIDLPAVLLAYQRGEWIGQCADRHRSQGLGSLEHDCFSFGHVGRHCRVFLCWTGDRTVIRAGGREPDFV